MIAVQKMKKKRSQSAVELIIILAIGLAMLIAVFEIFFNANTSFSGQLEAKKAKAAVDSIADAAERVHRQGVGSRTRLYVAIPDNVNYINLTNRLISMNLYSGGNARDVYRTVSFNVSGSIPKEEGNLFLYVESKEGYVRIGSNISDAAGCGNNAVEGSEICDGTDVSGQTCRTLGYSSGSLSCLSGCSGYDTSQCTTVITSLQLKPQSCAASANEESRNTYPDSCDGTYPSNCTNDKLSCDDSNYEEHNAGLNDYCGARANYYNTSISDCASISSVMVCHQWFLTSSAPSDCDISVARDYEKWQLVKDDYNGAERNNVVDIAAKPDGRLYILESDREVWESTDSGQSWTKIQNDYSGESQKPQFMLAAPNSNLYIIEGDEDVWRSSNNGLLWTKASSDFNGANSDAAGFAVNSSSALYAVDNKADVWVSTNNGTTWTLVNSDYSLSDADSGTDDMVSDANNFLYILRGQDVYRSNNSGINWTKINDDFNGGTDKNNGIEMINGNNSLFIIDGSEDIYKSIDNGTTWFLTTTDINGANGNIVGMASYNELIYAVDAVSDLWNMTDFYINWASVSSACHSSEPSVTCVNASSALSWSCSDFFGSGIDGAFIRHYTKSNEGSKSCKIDALYFNVSYVS